VRSEIAKSTPTTEPTARPSNATTASAASATTARSNASPRARGLEGGNLPQGQTYRVVRGDTLSGIASRIADRPVTINEAVDAIFAANPAAFTHGNIDLIEEGRSITIPTFMPSAAALAAPSTPAPVAIREAERPAAPPVAVEDPAPAPTSVVEPAPAATAVSAAAPEVSQPLPAGVPIAPRPSVAPVAAQPAAAAAPQAANPAATGRFSATFLAVLALGAVILVSAAVAFVRR